MKIPKPLIVMDKLKNKIKTQVKQLKKFHLLQSKNKKKQN